MAFKLCRYIKANGLQCRSPQLTGNTYCYYHHRIEHSHYLYRYSRGPKALQLGPTEDCEAIQLAISNVINALATDFIDTKRATALLYGLQLASMNAARLKEAPSYKDIVRATAPYDYTVVAEDRISTQDEDDAAKAQMIHDLLFEEIEEDEEDEEEQKVLGWDGLAGEGPQNLVRTYLPTPDSDNPEEAEPQPNLLEAQNPERVSIEQDSSANN